MDGSDETGFRRGVPTSVLEIFEAPWRARCLYSSSEIDLTGGGGSAAISSRRLFSSFNPAASHPPGPPGSPCEGTSQHVRYKKGGRVDTSEERGLFVAARRGDQEKGQCGAPCRQGAVHCRNYPAFLIG